MSEYYLNEKGEKNLNRQQIAEMLIKHFLQKDNDGRKVGKFISLKEFNELKLPKPAFLIENILPDKGINIIMGEPDSFKTWFCLYLLKCIHEEVPVLNSYATKVANILLINVDDPAGNLQERLNLMKIDGQKDGIFIWLGSEFHLADAAGEKTKFQTLLGDFIKQKKIGLIVFDTFRDIHLSDENNSQEMIKVIGLLKNLVHEYGVSLLLIHHERKNQEGKNSQNALRGSTAITGAATSMLQLKSDKRGPSIKVSQYKNKISRKINPFNVIYVENQETGNYFQIIDTPTSSSADEIKEAVLDYFKKNTEPGLGINNLIVDIKKNVKINAGKMKIKSAIEELTANDTLIVSQSKIHNSKMYQLNKHEDNQSN